MTTHDAKRVRRRGFTLLELTMAISVMAGAVLTAMATQLASLNLIKTTRESNVAMTDLSAAMEQVLILPVDQIPIATSQFAANQPIAAFTDRNLRDERIVATYPGFAAAVVPDPLTIVLTCTWTDWQNNQRQLTLTSLKTR